MQVALPALHISLGILDRLFRLYEDACRELDIKLATTAASVPVEAKEAYQFYVAQIREINKLNEKMEQCLQEALRYEEVAVQLAVYHRVAGDEESRTEVTELLKEAHKLRGEGDVMVREKSHIHAHIHSAIT